MDHSLVNRICGLIRENTSGQAGDQFFNLVLVAAIDDIIVHESVITVKISLLAHVLEKTSDTSSQMKNMSWFILLKHGFGFIIRSLNFKINP